MNTELACPPSLTNRERDVLLATVRGDSIKGIALSLRLSMSTVEYYRSSLYRKLGYGIPVLLAYAITEGIVPKDSLLWSALKARYGAV